MLNSPETILLYLKKYICTQKCTGTRSVKLYILPYAYKAFSRIKVNNHHNWNDIDYLINILIKTNEDLDDRFALKENMIFRWGILYHLYEMINQHTYKIFVRRFYELDSICKVRILSHLCRRIKTPEIIDFYKDRLLNGKNQEKLKAAHGIASTQMASSFEFLIDYLNKYPLNSDFNSIVLYSMVRNGYRGNELYSILDRLYTIKNKSIKRRVLRSALIIANYKVLKYIKDALQYVSLKRSALKILNKLKE